MKPRSREQEVRHEMAKAKRRAKRKSVPTEDVEQMKFIEWARKHAELVWHTPNARNYSRASWAYWEKMGVEAGIPDVLMILDGKMFALEFKRSMFNKISSEQILALNKMKRAGWRAFIVTSAERAIELVEESLR